MTVKLNPNNLNDSTPPFRPFTTQNFKNPPTAFATEGPTLILTDSDPGDLITLFASEPDVPGQEIELVVSFRVLPGPVRFGVDTGVRFAINDNARTIYVACIEKATQERGIAVATGTTFQDETNYGAFVATDWTNPGTSDGRVTFRIRRMSNGNAQLVEVNGVSLIPPLEVSTLPRPVFPRPTPTVELGCSNLEANATAEIALFETRLVAAPAAGTLTFRKLRIRDTDSTDRLNFRCDYTLGATTNGIDPATEQVTIKLSNRNPATGAFDTFYTKTVNGFTAHGQSPKRHWLLNDAQRAASGIERLMIKEDAAREGSIVLRDLAADPMVGADYSSVTAEIVIGSGTAADKLTASVTLVQRPAGSGRWREA